MDESHGRCWFYTAPFRLQSQLSRACCPPHPPLLRICCTWLTASSFPPFQKTTSHHSWEGDKTGLHDSTNRPSGTERTTWELRANTTATHIGVRDERDVSRLEAVLEPCCLPPQRKRHAFEAGTKRRRGGQGSQAVRTTTIMHGSSRPERQNKILPVDSPARGDTTVTAERQKKRKTRAGFNRTITCPSHQSIQASLPAHPLLTCVDRLLPEAHPCKQLPQSTQPFAFLGTTLGRRPEAAAPFHRLVWCWLTLREACGAGQPGAR